MPVVLCSSLFRRWCPVLVLVLIVSPDDYLHTIIHTRIHTRAHARARGFLDSNF